MSMSIVPMVGGLYSSPCKDGVAVCVQFFSLAPSGKRLLAMNLYKNCTAITRQESREGVWYLRRSDTRLAFLFLYVVVFKELLYIYIYIYMCLVQSVIVCPSMVDSYSRVYTILLPIRRSSFVVA